MNNQSIPFYKQTGFSLTLIIAILILLIPMITEHYKTLFVPESGNFKILGGINIILSIGLIKKWKFFWHLTSFILFATCILTIAFTLIGEPKYLIPRLSIGIILMLILLLTQSKAVKTYIFQDQHKERI